MIEIRVFVASFGGTEWKEAQKSFWSERQVS